MAQSDYLKDLRDYINESAKITPDSQLRNYVKTTFLTLDGNALPLRVPFDQTQEFIGRQVGLTKWFLVDQKRMNKFAEATGDYQFIHIDKDRTARETCYDGTIAHGMLTISLLTTFATAASLKIEGTRQTIIYGMDNVRFLNPVRIGSRIRGRFVLSSASERRPGEILLRHSVTIEIEDEDKPALLADWLVLSIL
ncbi:MAG: MaoC family dehydratase [Pseudohongiella sp.]|nr:MaoC family dehydratase [Pseudohongiella sp.]MDO9519468.1 MaoC family dehydratase [Pseudohongiella sp.]MDP2127524.1 MaoC family dehydratase [Pseudohongiella sp.]